MGNLNCTPIIPISWYYKGAMSCMRQKDKRCLVVVLVRAQYFTYVLVHATMCPFGLEVLLRSAFAFWTWDPRYSKRNKRVLLHSFFVFLFLFLFLFLFSRVSKWCGYCSCTVAWTVTANVDFSTVNSYPCTVHGPINSTFQQLFH